MLGIGLTHLLPDADDDLSEILPDYKLAFAFTAFGVVLNLTLEQVALIYLASRKLARENISGASSNSDIINITNEKLLSITEQDSSANKESAGSDEAAEMVASLVQAEGLRELVALYAMELSVSVHSIIIGADIGLLAGSDSLATLVALICAISFHQCVEGLGLGAVLRSVREHDHASRAKLVVFVTLFTCSAPVGIVIGICTSSQGESDAGTAAKGAANALAAGSLLYISLTEMVASYFASPDLVHRPVLKLMMVAAFFLGVASMAVIAIWA